jgi:hypothetical protein
MIKSHYTVEGEPISVKELGLALYHIANKTDVSKGYTLKFVHDVLSAASEALYKDYGVTSTVDDDEIDHRAVEELSDAFEQQRSYRYKRQEWLTSYNKPRICFYHNVEHKDSGLPHSCSSDPDKLCFCCSEGMEYCERMNRKPKYLYNPEKKNKY